jgi:hypothetical protein
MAPSSNAGGVINLAERRAAAATRRKAEAECIAAGVVLADLAKGAESAHQWRLMIEARALELRAARVHAEHEAELICKELDAAEALPPSYETQDAIVLLQQRARDLELHVGEVGTFIRELTTQTALRKAGQ